MSAGRGTSGGLRERKKLATRQALGLAAMRLAVARGLDQVLVEDIANEVGVSPRTFNNYFSSKYEAICSLAVDRTHRIGAALLARPVDEPLWDAITVAVLEQFEGTGAPDKAWTTGVRLVTSTPALRGEYLKAQDGMRRELAEAIAVRTNTDLDHDMFARIVAGAVTVATDVALDQWLTADSPTALRVLLRLALRHLADGVPARTGA
jgi:AcrR family transcriptional regulator